MEAAHPILVLGALRALPGFGEDALGGVQVVGHEVEAPEFEERPGVPSGQIVCLGYLQGALQGGAPASKRAEHPTGLSNERVGVHPAARVIARRQQRQGLLGLLSAPADAGRIGRGVACGSEQEVGLVDEDAAPRGRQALPGRIGGAEDGFSLLVELLRSVEVVNALEEVRYARD